MKIGFIGLGNVGNKLAGSLLRNKFELTVLDLDRQNVEKFVKKGAIAGETPKQMMHDNDVLITCLPNPEASRQVIEGENGALSSMSQGKIWMEMSTTDANEVKRLAKIIEAHNGEIVDAPVSGGCHRADTGNISIFAGTKRSTFETVLPILTTLGRRVLHTGEIGSASVLKVVTNYLATANLVSCCEALATVAAAGMDLNTAYEAIRISSGTSFVHETESQVILNGSRDISFTMDLVLKDIGLFDQFASDNNVPLEISPLLIKIFQDGVQKYGSRAFSPNIIKRLEDKINVDVLGSGFPEEMVDDEAEEKGYEIITKK